MAYRAVLIAELESSRALLDIIVHKRKKKIIVRWILGIIFYATFWHISWLHYLLWISIVLELILLWVTVRSYFRLSAKIKLIQEELKHL